MDFGIFGPLRVTTPDGPVDLGSTKLRTLFAVLLARPNEIVPYSQLADAVWSAAPPKRVKNALHVSVHRLRKLLGDPARIVHRAGGYTADVRVGELDSQLFEQFVREARTARGAGRQETARQLFRTAVKLWRGKPFAEFDDVDLLQVEARLLTERYVMALEELAELDLALGHTADVVAGMSVLTGEHPFRERAHELLMLALVRSGSPGESLRHYERLREHLATDLGTDPSDRLRRLHQRILVEDPELLEPPRTVVPRQLPPQSPLFTGRNPELSTISRAVDERAIVVITGPGGIGKSALALRWAHDNIDRGQDGQLYLNLRGYSPAGTPMSAGEALRTLLVSLGVNESELPVGIEAQAGLYRSLLATRRVLIVLDNARDTEHVLPLLPGSTTCVVLVTSRHQLAALVASQGAHALALRGLDDHAAQAVLTGHVGPDRTAAEQDAADDIVRRCAGLPLALVTVGARAAVDPAMTLWALAEELRDDSARLDALQTGELSADVRAVVAASCRVLDDDAIMVFELLGLAPGPDVGLHAVANLADRAPAEARAILRRLETVHLAHRDQTGRFAMHDLVRLYAHERALGSQPAANREAALARLRGFYLHTAYSGERILDPHRPGIEPPNTPSTCVTAPLSGAADAIRWFETEHQNLLCVLRDAVASGCDREVWLLAWALHTFHLRRGHLVDGLSTWKAALDAADRLGDRGMRARAHRRLAVAGMRVGHHAEAWTHVRAALALFEELRDLAGQARTHEAAAWIAEQRGDDRRALVHADRALQLHRLQRDPRREANALNTIGYYRCRLGLLDEAVIACESALASHRRHAYRDGEAYALDTLGFIARSAGRIDEALGWYSQAVPVLRELDDTYQMADTLACLGEIQSALGRSAAARCSLNEALALYRIQRRQDQVLRVRGLLEAL